MMYVLDTIVVSELRKVRSGKADAGVCAWADEVDASDLYLSAITVMELELGVARVERRDALQGAALRTWLEDQVLQELRSACYRLMRTWHCAVRACMSLIRAVNAMR